MRTLERWEGGGVKARERRYKCVEYPPYPDNIIVVCDSKSLVVLALTIFFRVSISLREIRIFKLLLILK